VLEFLVLLMSVVPPDSPPPVPETTPSGLDLNWLGPVVTSLGAIVVATIGGVSIAWRRKQDRNDALEDKQSDSAAASQPNITDGWEEVRQARMEATRYYNLYRGFEDAFYVVSTALRRLVRSTRTAHSEFVFEQDVLDALAVVPPDTADIK